MTPATREWLVSCELRVQAAKAGMPEADRCKIVYEIAGRTFGLDS